MILIFIFLNLKKDNHLAKTSLLYFVRSKSHNLKILKCFFFFFSFKCYCDKFTHVLVDLDHRFPNILYFRMHSRGLGPKILNFRTVEVSFGLKIFKLLNDGSIQNSQSCYCGGQCLFINFFGDQTNLTWIISICLN